MRAKSALISGEASWPSSASLRRLMILSRLLGFAKLRNQRFAPSRCINLKQGAANGPVPCPSHALRLAASEACSVKSDQWRVWLIMRPKGGKILAPKCHFGAS
jgi:hypothetical protein